MEREWINSGINVAWISQHLPAGVEDRFDDVWDELQGRSEWRAWMQEHDDAVKGPFNYLEISDRAQTRIVRRSPGPGGAPGSGDLVYLMAVTDLEVADLLRSCRRLIHDVLSIRAEMVGVPAPPDVDDGEPGG